MNKIKILTLVVLLIGCIVILISENVQLGSETKSSKPTPKIGPDTKWFKIACGNGHSLAITVNGTLWAWGSNESGQLGDGTTIDQNVPTRIGGPKIIWLKIACGQRHTIAIKSDSTLWAWGNNESGQLGLGNSDSNPHPEPTQIGTDADWWEVMASQYRTIALKKNGTLWAWGNNESGQLGDGTTINKTSPAQVLTDTNWSKIAAGGTHTVALKVNGTLWAWGMNDYGQLGDGTTISKTTPTRIGTANNWSRIAAGRTHTLGIKMDGTLWAWGNNEWGKLGDGTSGVLNSKKSPGKIGNASDWSKIVAGRAHTFALTKEGKLWTWGDCYYGQLGLGDAMWRAAPTRVGKATSTDWKEIAAGANHNLAIKTDGSLWAWGHNGNGQLGLGDTYNRHAPTLVK